MRLYADEWPKYCRESVVFTQDNKYKYQNARQPANPINVTHCPCNDPLQHFVVVSLPSLTEEAIVN